jgi:nondiscriminating aspartyl-tRNA synthetase
MPRTLNIDSIGKIGETVLVRGWVNTRRDHGKIVFVDLRDRTGLLQLVMTGDQAGDLHSEDVISVTGQVKKRPENLVNPKIPTGEVELAVEKIDVLSRSAELPFDMSQPELKLELPTLLDFRSLTLRHPKVRPIFKVQAAVMEGFKIAARKLDCTEIFVPTISASATEGGAEVFKVDYYKHPAYLIQSPQLYKQMLVPAFERVFVVSHAYRSEPSVTTRHLSESVQMDCELGFVDFPQLLDSLEFVGVQTLRYVAQACPDILAAYGIPQVCLPDKPPRLTMRQAQQIIKDRTGTDHTRELDLTPEDEREISSWALQTHNSDLVTITHYPTAKRAFYTMPDPDNPEYSLSYDLLFRGMEILSGSQRINDYRELVSAMKDRGLDPDDFGMYLQAFRYGMPPEGGFSFGLERMTMQILQLGNIREASLFPRDMERVDVRFSALRKRKKKRSTPKKL